MGRLGMVVLAAAGVSLVPAIAHAQACLKMRPTDPGGHAGYDYGAAPVASYATANVRVHYATSGPHQARLQSTRGDNVPDDVVHAAEVTEDSLGRYQAMGFRAPKGDGDYAACSSNGGDARLDVYLVAFKGSDGMTVSEACSTSGKARRCSSYIMAEATFAGRGYKSYDDAVRTVLPHELFHAIQNAYDSDLDGFWGEGSAQWAADHLQPSLEDMERQMPAFFAETSRSLDTPPGGATAGFLYGSAVWPVYLTTRHGVDVVRAILDEEGKGQGGTLASTDVVLKGHGDSLAEAFPLFAVWNGATGSRAGDPSLGGYPDGARYPTAKVTDVDGAVGVEVKGITSGLSAYYYRVAVDEPRRVVLDTDGERNAGYLLPLEDGKARMDQAAPLPAVVRGEALVVVAGRTTKKTDAPFTVRVDVAPVETTGGADGGATSAPGGSEPPDEGCAVAALVGTRARGRREGAWPLAFVSGGLAAVVWARLRRRSAPRGAR